MLLVKKCQFFLYLVLVTTRLELRFNNVLGRKGLTHAIGQKMPILCLFGFDQNKTRKKV